MQSTVESADHSSESDWAFSSSQSWMIEISEIHARRFFCNMCRLIFKRRTKELFSRNK